MKYTASAPTTVIEALGKLLEGANKTTLKQYLKFGRVRLNGVVVKVGDTPIAQGAVVEIVNITKERRRKADFQIIWEDKDMIVVIKPAGVLSAGEGITRAATMHKTVHEFVKEESRGKKGAFVVHRLDKEVTGLMIFAKSESVQEKLKENWSRYTKKYLALTEAKPPREQGTIDTYLAEFKQTMHVVKPDVPGAVRAISHYRYIRPEGKYHLLEVTLETGKKNQVRVHLAHLGCHIVGDRKYGADDTLNLKVRLLSQCIEITHPVGGKALKWEIQPDSGFLNPNKEARRIIKKLG
jgi:23S rRNA pseudouridine1911/1915/1917 synthase